MTENPEMQEYIDELYDSYVSDGLDFNTDQTLHEIFKQIFTDAVLLTIEDVAEEIEKDDPPESPGGKES